MRPTILCVMITAAAATTAAAQENRAIVGDTARRHTAPATQIVYADPTNYAAVRANLAKASRPTFGQRLAERLRRPLLTSEPARNLDIAATAGIGNTQETGVAVAIAATGRFSAAAHDRLKPLSAATLAATDSVTGFFRMRSTGGLLLGRGE